MGDFDAFDEFLEGDLLGDVAFDPTLGSTTGMDTQAGGADGFDMGTVPAGGAGSTDFGLGGADLTAPIIEGNQVLKPDVVALFPNAEEHLKPTVVGVIAFMDMGVGLDLRQLACGCRNVEYTPSRSPSATLRIRDPPCVALVRNSGSASLVGAASIGGAKQAASLAARIIRKVLQIPVRKVRFRVSSIMARFDLKHPIRLDELHRNNTDTCSYEPESFCGCVMKLRGPENAWAISLSIFVTGKVTMTGAKSEWEAQQAFNMALPLIAPYAKKNVGENATQ